MPLALTATNRVCQPDGSFETDIQTVKRKSTVCSGIFFDTSKPYCVPLVEKMLTNLYHSSIRGRPFTGFGALVWMHRAARDQRCYAIMPFYPLSVIPAMMRAPCDLPSECDMDQVRAASWISRGNSHLKYCGNLRDSHMLT